MQRAGLVLEKMDNINNFTSFFDGALNYNCLRGEYLKQMKHVTYTNNYTKGTINP